MTQHTEARPVIDSRLRLVYVGRPFFMIGLKTLVFFFCRFHLALGSTARTSSMNSASFSHTAAVLKQWMLVGLTDFLCVSFVMGCFCSVSFYRFPSTMSIHLACSEDQLASA